MRAAIVLAALGTVTLAAVPSAQVASTARAFSFFTEDAERPRLGISTRSTGKRDTLGLMVERVTEGSPAEKAGIEEGDRLVSVNGVNLRLSRDDAEDEEMSGVATRRLTRELAKHKAGDEVEVRLYRDGQARTVRAKLVEASDLDPSLKRFESLRQNLSERAVLGISLGGSGSKRDTLGVLVVGVSDDGPAGKAGIEEGDRIASINGVDLRVDRDDAGDWEASSARIRRLNRAMEKVKVGDDVDLRVYTQGQTRSVRAKAARAVDVKGTGGGFFFDGGFGIGGKIQIAPKPSILPKAVKISPRIYSDNAASVVRTMIMPRLQVEAQARAQVDVQRRVLDEVRRSLEARRRALRFRYDGIDDRLEAEAAPAPTALPATRAATAVTAISSTPRPAPSLAPAVTRTVAAGPRWNVTAPAYATTVMSDAGRGDAISAVGARSFGLPGLRLATVSEDLASYFGRGSERGLLVLDVTDQWPGIHNGDVILSVDGRPVRSADGSTSVAFPDGRSAVVVLRAGKRVSVNVVR